MKRGRAVEIERKWRNIGESGGWRVEDGVVLYLSAEHVSPRSLEHGAGEVNLN